MKDIFYTCLGLFMIAFALYGVGFLSRDRVDFTLKALIHAQIWAEKHGFEGPVTCGPPPGVFGTSRCTVRRMLADTSPVRLICDTVACEEQ